ncbi:MAG: malto-oligosyltrehalose trehalohydrolase [Proteobacteria bacterium]|nr:malto-oligosyltrehalose trehalohydrolase [Pseudomonadota bacterium]
MRAIERRLPVGAEAVAGQGAHFRVWAPRARRVEAVLEGPRARGRVALEPEAGGYHAGWAKDAGPGTLYRYSLDGEEPYPDPASRFQPQGPHGPSEIVDPDAYAWRADGWPGLIMKGQVLYELHVGTFTREGTWAAAAEELGRLAQLGVTAVEVMPVAEFPGRFGWGYDGTCLFAPTRLYGRPDDFKRFVDCAHEAGLGVVLDVVYNHFGPDGNYLSKFAELYFNAARPTDWGPAINYDGEGAAPVREFVLSNAAYWISEFRLDGLRLDSTDNVRDESPTHVLAELSARARAAAGRRRILLVAENESQEARLLASIEDGGFGLDGVWNDDFHHAARVAMTGRREGYYSGYSGAPQELLSAALGGFLYQGQYYAWQQKRRGSPTAAPIAAFIQCLENHDQIANSLCGRRLRDSTSPARRRVMTALLLLGPGTPLLFQGQEYDASTPFAYFADHPGELGRAVREGRAVFLNQFENTAEEHARRFIPDPGDPATFERCRLDPAERARNAEATALVRDLLRLRRSDSVLREQRADIARGAVLGPAAFAIRFSQRGGHDRLFLVNLGADFEVAGAAPILAPPAGSRWERAWTSESPRYGGEGAFPPEDERGRWRLQAESASFLKGVTRV